MPITVNLRHLENKNVQLEGELSPQELEAEELDEMVQANSPLKYDLQVERSGDNLLVHGKVDLRLDCECVRCLKPFHHDIHWEAYQAIIPLEGEEKAPVVNDLVDLTPYLREDILLAFPPHPVCESECDRLPPTSQTSEQAGDSGQNHKSAWDELNKLKL